MDIFVVGFFGLGGAIFVKKLFDNKPGLIFSGVGIFDNSSALSVGLIPWQDIVGFSHYEVTQGLTHKFLIVKVADPDKYIEVGNNLERKLHRISHRMYGSPIIIPSTFLKISFSDLQRTAGEYFSRYGKREVAPQI